MARVILGYRDEEPSEGLLTAIERGQLAGLLWFRESLGGTVEEAAARIAHLRGVWPAGVACLFAADEEGGLIQQLENQRARACDSCGVACLVVIVLAAQAVGVLTDSAGISVQLVQVFDVRDRVSVRVGLPGADDQAREQAPEVGRAHRRKAEIIVR